MDEFAAKRLTRVEKSAQYVYIIKETMRRQGISGGQAANHCGCDRSLISKIMNGRSELTPNMNDKLMDLARIDRARACVAVEIMGDGSLYYDPAFKNVACAVTVFTEDLISSTRGSGPINYGALLAGLSRTCVGDIIRNMVRHLEGQFARVYSGEHQVDAPVQRQNVV